MFKVIESGPTRDDCLLFGWVLMIKCVSGRKSFITNAKDGGLHIYLANCLSLWNWQAKKKCYGALAKCRDTTKSNFLNSRVNIVGKKHPSSSTCACTCSWPPVIFFFLTTTISAHCWLRISGEFLKGTTQMYSKAQRIH